MTWDTIVYCICDGFLHFQSDTMVTSDEPTLDITYVTKCRSKVIRCILMIFSRELILKTIHGCIMLKIHGLPPHFHTIFFTGMFNLVNVIFKNASTFLLPKMQKGCFFKCWRSGRLIFYGFHLFGASCSTLTMQLVMNDTPYFANSTIWAGWHICTTYNLLPSQIYMIWINIYNILACYNLLYTLIQMKYNHFQCGLSSVNLAKGQWPRNIKKNIGIMLCFFLKRYTLTQLWLISHTDTLLMVAIIAS